MARAWLYLLALTQALGAAEKITSCGTESVEFILLEGDAVLAQIEDDIRADLAKVDIAVKLMKHDKEDFNSNMTAGNFNLCFSETWGPPYDPHGYAASWKAPDEAHYAALKGMKAPFTQATLTSDISDVLNEENAQKRVTEWKRILASYHEQAIDLPFSGKRMPTVLSKRLTGYTPGQQQYDYPVHTLQVLNGSKTITVAPGSQTGLFDSVGRLDPHTYRPNEFFANNWVYESFVSYGADGVIQPSLATGWTVTDLAAGGQQYQFFLREGVQFHDGEEWNCAAAKLNFDHVLTPALTTGDWHGWYDLPKQIKSWSCAGKYEFILTTKDKYYPLLQELCYIRPLRMLSPANFKNGAATDPKTHNSCHVGWNDKDTGNIQGNGETIVCAGITGVAGTGPWKYDSTAANGDATFQRNINHWGTVPQVETIVLKKFATATAVFDALKAKTLDVVWGGGVLKPADLKSIQTSYTKDFSVFLGPPIMNRVIIMNTNKAPTDDLRIRKVIMHAIDKAAIIEKELLGFAKPVDQLFPTNAPYCDLDLTPRWAYDFEKAQLLRCPTQGVAGAAATTGFVAGVAVTIAAVFLRVGL